MLLRIRPSLTTCADGSSITDAVAGVKGKYGKVIVMRLF